ncbi:unnamed protein product [Boreogadus saida]
MAALHSMGWVGYSWLPLLREGRLASQEFSVPVSCSLPPGYLALREPNSTKNSSDVKWVDGGKPIFKVSTNVLSTVYTQDPHLNRFFQQCQKRELDLSLPPTSTFLSCLKGLLSMDRLPVIIRFLPVLFNRLFKVLTENDNDEVTTATTRVLLHIVAKCHEESLDHYLHSYIKYVFQTESQGFRTVHEELAKGMTFDLKSGEPAAVRSVLRFSWFFFELIIKSMAQHLVQSDTVKAPRPQRFPSSYLGRLETLLETLSDHVYWKHKELPEETRSSTLAVAAFVKRCFTLMDRGFTFKLISNYVTMITASDSKMLCALKFEFLREVCNHEHYIPLSLPLPSARITDNASPVPSSCHVCVPEYSLTSPPSSPPSPPSPPSPVCVPEYSLTGEFCRKHFLTGLLLRELGLALQDEQDLRHLALATLKTLMAKHSLDARYATKEKQARIASLYLPLYGLILDNMPRFFLRDMFPYYTSSTQVPPPTRYPPPLHLQHPGTPPHYTSSTQVPPPTRYPPPLHLQHPGTPPTLHLQHPGTNHYTSSTQVHYTSSTQHPGTPPHHYTSSTQVHYTSSTRYPPHHYTSSTQYPTTTSSTQVPPPTSTQVHYTSSTQGSRDDLSVGGVAAGGLTPHVVRHGNSVDASFSKEVLNSITAFSSLAVATGTQAECRGSLLSVDSNPCSAEGGGAKADGCEKVRGRTARRGAGPRPTAVRSAEGGGAKADGCEKVRGRTARRGGGDKADGCEKVRGRHSAEGGGDKADGCEKFARPQSLIGYGSRCDKLDQAETRSLLMCFLHIMKTISEDVLVSYWHRAVHQEISDFFNILELCLQHFRFLGKRHIARKLAAAVKLAQSNQKGSNQHSQHAQSSHPTGLLPQWMAVSGGDGHRHARSQTMPIIRGKNALNNPKLLHMMETDGNIPEGDTLSPTDIEANLSTEVSLTVLDVLGLFVQHHKKQLLMDEGQNVMKKVLDTYLLFFQINQSTTTLRHVFAALRLFVQKFPSAFFQGKADLCGCLCYEILKCCNHRSSSTQTEASALLYCVMRHNFEFTKGKSMVRSHLQVIKAVSQLIADAGIGGSRFQQSLAIINNFANGDAPLKSTPFPTEVKDLTRRIRTVLMATAQMKEHEKDPEMLVDLQVSLANSYASTPELRRTWLESMAKVHVRNGDLSEAAMCYIHISALIAESLKRRGYWRADKARMSHGAAEESPVFNRSSLLTSTRDSDTSFSMGWAAFMCISPNVKEEGAMKEDTGTLDTPYTEDTLVEQLELCVDYLWKSERYELIADINKPIIAVFEKRRDFKRLSELYYDIHRSYLKVTEVVNSEKRLFGRYYRVAFYGQGFFEEEESKEFIYKEPKLTGLSEISQRLLKLYSDKFGADNVKMIQDSNKVNPKDLDPRFAYIQVTYVVPFFDGEEEQDKRTDFEQHHNISRFVFETPFTLSGKKHGEVEEQCKRRTVLSTSSSFPYLKKRIQVVEQQSTEMNPLEVAIDEMSRKVSELNALCSMQEVDMIRLQLKLQGSVSAKVNAGPMAYARAFLEEKNAKKYPDNQVKLLKEIFRRFADACGQALDVNERLIKEDQLEYQEEMRAHYRDLLSELSAIMNEQIPHARPRGTERHSAF